MRTLFYSIVVLSTTATVVSAQSAQYSVDIAVSSAVFAKGAVQAVITRKDPPGFTVSPELKVQVSVGVMGQKGFYFATLAMKPGSSQSVSAPFNGNSSNVTFTVSATLIARSLAEGANEVLLSKI